MFLLSFLFLKEELPDGNGGIILWPNPVYSTEKLELSWPLCSHFLHNSLVMTAPVYHKEVNRMNNTNVSKSSEDCPRGSHSRSWPQKSGKIMETPWTPKQRSEYSQISFDGGNCLFITSNLSYHLSFSPFSITAKLSCTCVRQEMKETPSVHPTLSLKTQP